MKVMLFLQVSISYQSFVRDMYEDLTQKLINSSAEENTFASQPCRDNTFYLVKLVDEMLISELDNRLPVCCCYIQPPLHDMLMPP